MKTAIYQMVQKGFGFIWLKISQGPKLPVFIFLTLLFFSSCTKQDLNLNSNEKNDEVQAKAKVKDPTKNSKDLNVCHQGQIKLINIDTWPQHQAHGDVRLDDQDSDGYVPNNSCGYGVQGDCNDNNAFIRPGVAEICNGVDDNCNGVIDESCFPAVIIGNQVWMSRNLEVTTYRNGDPISSSWGNPFGAWCYYGNDPANGTVYGKLFNWYAVHDSRGLAPSGWHIPSEYEWNVLCRTLDPATDTTNLSSIFSFTAGGALKETGVAHWLSPNNGATNSSGFTALPGGWRDDDGTFYTLGTHGVWWSANGNLKGGDGSHGYARGRFIRNDETYIGVFSQPVVYGLSVRCVRD